MNISQQGAERLFPFYMILVSLAILALYSSMSAASSLTGVVAIYFWVLQLGMLTGALILGCSWVKWPKTSWNEFSLKSTFVAAIASLVLALPSFLLDIAFGMVRLDEMGKLSEVGFASFFGEEYTQEVLILFVPCLFVVTVVNWLKCAGPFATPKYKVPLEIIQPQSITLEVQSQPQFWSKLKRRQYGRLLALEAQEHYVLVHTTAGTELILYCFGDAVKELTDWEGAQVHRSFWVARSAIRDVIVEGRTSYAILTSSTKVPISRRRKKEALANFAP